MTRDTCNARNGDLPVRCELEPGHRGFHACDLGSRVVRWENHRGGARVVQGLSRSPIKKQSDKQKIRTAFLAGIKATLIWQQFLKLGHVQCEECGRVVFVGEEIDESAWIEAAMSHIDGHHVTARDRGRGYVSPNDHGVDSPANIQLLCRRCHEKTEPEPQFSGGAS